MKSTDGNSSSASKLQNELAKKVRAVDELERRSPTDIWQEDLRAIELALDEWDLEKAAALGEEPQAQLKSQKHQKQKATKAPAKPRVQKKLVMAKKLSDKMYVKVGNGCEGWRWDGVGCGGCRWI